MNIGATMCIFISMKTDTNLEKVKERVEGSHRFVAILFTDIVDSTKHWHRTGDIHGRLILDRHNRLLFPIIKKYNGRVIKTIGDSIMASFNSIDKSLQAAIACQQLLKKERSRNKEFKLHIRIGLHCGNALVEKNDVFGDVVNVAARVESEACTDQVLISSAIFHKLKRRGYRLTRYKSFVPKGKSKKILLYSSNWKSISKDYSKRVQSESLGKLKTGEELLSIITLLTGITLFSKQYLFNLLLYWGVDPIRNVSITKLFTNPLFWGVVIALTILGFSLKSTQLISRFRSMIIACTWGTSLFILLFLTSIFTDIRREKYDRVLFEGDSFVVTILETGYLHHRAGENSGVPAVDTVSPGDLFVLKDVRRRDGWRWNRVETSDGLFWVEGYRPQSLRPTPAWRISESNKFYFFLSDGILLSVSVLCSIFVFIVYRIRRVRFSPL